MSVFNEIFVDLEIQLGSANVPIRQILKMSRGAIIPLDCSQDDPSVIIVNGQPVAKGQVLVHDEQMSLEVTEVLQARG